MSITEGRVAANDLEFAYLEAGDGPLTLCLHGFPDSAWTYRFLLPALADAGFHGVAPWMRGYAPTAVPDDGRYQTAAGVLQLRDIDLSSEADGGCCQQQTEQHRAGVAHEHPRWEEVVRQETEAGASDSDRDEA